MKATRMAIKNNLQGNSSRVDEAENQISNLEYNKAKNNQSEQKEEEKIQKDEDSIRSLWDNFKYINICIIVVPEEEREQRIENLFEEKRHTNLASIDSAEQDEPKEAHTKTHHN